MKIEWKFRYTEEGDMNPDKHGRWAVVGYIWVDAEKATPEMGSIGELYNRDGKVPYIIAWINKDGTNEKPFTCTMGSSTGMGAGGYSWQTRYTSRNLKSMQNKITRELNRLQRIFKYVD
jgi:hypothetical protein